MDVRQGQYIYKNIRYFDAFMTKKVHYIYEILIHDICLKKLFKNVLLKKHE